jgi:hypothetical protein
MRKTILIGALAALGGCGGDSGSALEGIYVITEWTENTTACTEGPSILGFDTAMFVRYETFFGTSYLHAMPCADVAACAEMAAEEDTLFLGGYFLDRGSDGEGWIGDDFDQSSFDGTCEGNYIEYVLTGEVGADVRVEGHAYPVEPFPEDEDGFCDSRAAREAATETCTGLEVLVATYDSDI